MIIDSDRRCYLELIAVVTIGTLHIATEIAFSLAVSRAYNAAAAAIIGAYVLSRYFTTDGIARDWEFRCDNFWKALRLQLAIGAPATVLLYGFGMLRGIGALPLTFWLAAALYPLWGIAQQFVLQNLIAKNVSQFVPYSIPCALLSAALFGLSHDPRVPLVALAFFAGFGFTLS